MRAGGTYRLNRGRSTKRGVHPLEQASEATFRSTPSSVVRYFLQGMFCVASLVLGFRITQEANLIGLNSQHPEYSLRLSVFSSKQSASIGSGDGSSEPSSQQYVNTTVDLRVHEANVHRLPHPDAQLPYSLPNVTKTSTGVNGSEVYVGRHPILIRPWPHPDPFEMVQAYGLIERVQLEQQRLYGVKAWKPTIAITPTYVRTFQAVYLTGLLHTLSLVRGPVTWIVIEAGGVSNETATLLKQSQVHRLLHLGSPKPMPPILEDRGVMEAHLRVEGLRFVREQKLEGLVVFADESNVYSLDFFDEIQKVNWVGALSIGMLGHAGFGEPAQSKSRNVREEIMGGGEGRQMLASRLQGSNSPTIEPQVQGPTCNSTGAIVGWHVYNPLPLDGEVVRGATGSGRRLEWPGFVLNARTVWASDADLPDWIKSWVDWSIPKDGVFTELKSIVRDEKHVETLGDCGRKVLVWWVRMEARADSKFPSRWKLDSQLEIVVPARSTPWPDRIVKTPPSLVGLATSVQTDKRKGATRGASRDGKSRRSRRRQDAAKGRVAEDGKDIVATKGLQTRSLMSTLQEFCKRVLL